MLNIIALCFLACFSWTSGITIHMQQTPTTCACQDRRLCQPLVNKSSWEVVGYTYGSPQIYKMFNWNRLTTVVVDGAVSPSLVCFAHSKGVKVHKMLVPSRGDIMSEAGRINFVRKTLANVRLSHLDGLNMDFEGSVKHNGPVYNGLTDLMRKLRVGLHIVNPVLQLTMAVRYYPFRDGPFAYDFANIKQLVNYFIIMDYDLQGVAYSSERASQRGSCLTSSYLSNSPLPLVTKGAKQFLLRGITGAQLVMALPWYGRSNACVKFDVTKSACYVPCGKQFSRKALSYRTIMRILRTSSEQGRIWNTTSATPTLTHIYQGKRYQVNYDDPVSLRLKWKEAVRLNFLGAAIWIVDYLDYSNSSTAARDRKAMWDSIPYGFQFRRRS